MHVRLQDLTKVTLNENNSFSYSFTLTCTKTRTNLCVKYGAQNNWTDKRCDFTPTITQLCESTLIIDRFTMTTRAPSQVIRIKFTSCFRLGLPLLTLHSRGRYILGASWPVTHPSILMIRRCGGQKTVQLQLCSIWTATEIELWRASVVLKIISEDKDESTFRFAHVHFIVTDN